MAWFVIIIVVIFFVAISTGSKKKKSNSSNKYPKISDSDIQDAEKQKASRKDFDLNFQISEHNIIAAETVVFDIETTGLPLRRNASPAETEVWPYIVQIAWAVFDLDGNIIEKESYLVKQKKPIPYEATRIHGITTSRANAEGEDIKVVLTLFLKHIHYASKLVAHNIEFDLPIIEAEFIRNKFEYSLKGKDIICTMKSSVNYCAIQKSKGYGYKHPKLTELVGCLFFGTYDVTIPDAHDAKIDMLMAAKCFFELKRLNQTSDLNYDTESISDYKTILDEKIENNRQQIEANKIDGIDAGVDRENPFFHKNIVITGTFRNFNKQEWLVNILTRLGGKVCDSINYETDILICGEQANSDFIESLQNLNTKKTVTEIANEDVLLTALNGQILVYYENGDKYVCEKIIVEDGIFKTSSSSGSVSYLQFQEFYDYFVEIKNLEKTDVQTAITDYYDLAEDYPLCKGYVYERLEIIYRKQKDYENEMRICLLDIEARSQEKEKEKMNAQAIEKLRQRYEKAKKLSYKQ